MSGHRTERATGVELISMVSDPRLDVERIAPYPCGRNVALARLVSLDRQDFLEFLRQRSDAAREKMVRFVQTKPVGYAV